MTGVMSCCDGEMALEWVEETGGWESRQESFRGVRMLMCLRLAVACMAQPAALEYRLPVVSCFRGEGQCCLLFDAHIPLFPRVCVTSFLLLYSGVHTTSTTINSEIHI